MASQWLGSQKRGTIVGPVGKVKKESRQRKKDAKRNGRYIWI
jgi:hypothetical protein